MLISQVLDTVRSRLELPDHPERTMDTVKIGDPEQICTGIAVTVYVSVNVIRSAVKNGCNLIIGHEPLFYGDAEGSPLIEKNPVYMEKRRLLEEYGIVVYRHHDRMHGPGGPGAKVHTRIDHIYYGIMKELGWEEYVIGEHTKPVMYRIPETTGNELAQILLKSFDLKGMRIVGDPDTKVRTVYLCEHVFGSEHDYEIIEKASQADAVIPLEIVDWTLTEYIRDCCQCGKKKVIFEMGHFNTEELGMRYMTKWLRELLGGQEKVIFIPSGDQFEYMTRF